MIYLVLALALALFVAVLKLGRVVERSFAVVSTMREATGVMTSTTLSDDEKETRIQRDALAMLRAFAMLLFWSVCAIGLTILFVVSGGALDLYDTASVIAAAESWEVIVVAGIAMTALFVVR